MDLLIGTPGRLCDVLKSGNINLSRVKVAVLDEADEMLKMGFAKEVDAIYEGMPSARERQNLLFSATFAKGVQNIAKKYMNDVLHINLVGKDDSKIPDDIEILSLVSRWKNREEQLGNILNLYCSGKDGVRALVFTSTKLGCEQLASSKAVVQSGIVSLPLHGDMSQNARENALEAFRSRRVKCLIATDVAARGLDIPEVDLVIHYELPQQKESFVHRTGRTGRAGRKGINIVMHDLNHRDEIRDIERHIQREFVKMPQPRAREIVDIKGEATIERILKMSPRTISTYKTIAERLRTHLEAEGMEIDPLAASLCLASGFESNFSFSDLTGEEGVETVFVSCSDPSTLRLPSSLRKGMVSNYDFFKVKDRLEVLVSGIVSENYKNHNRSGLIRHIEICKDLKGVLMDVSPDIAECLLDSHHHELEISFNPIEHHLPEYAEVQRKDRGNKNKNNEKRGGRYAGRGDRKFKAKRQGREYNGGRSYDNSNGGPRKNQRRSHNW
uniref:RNA helicase n=1 Tax=Aplanochytrium stocchinoi TaxID=215587 RepID=A0A7S3LKJ9_9STRA